MRPRATLPRLLRSILVPGLLLAGSARAEELPAEGGAPIEIGPAASKRGDHLFHPTPSALLREMSTDRPDLTESPHTVDAGHVQIELEAAHFEREKSEGRTEEEIGGMSANAKIGLLPSVDLQLGFNGIARRTAAEPGAPEEKESGPGDTYLRVKWNLWGNDGGPTALALMPFLVLPTGSDAFGEGSTQPGLIVPFGWAWPADFDFGAMVQVDSVEDSDEEGRHAEWLTTATVGHALHGNLSAFAEFTATMRPAEEGPWIGTVDLGLVLAATPNVQLDGGAILGVSEAAEGLGLFLGLSVRR